MNLLIELLIIFSDFDSIHNICNNIFPTAFF